jgi:predicted nucleic acid-binding protein
MSPSPPRSAGRQVIADASVLIYLAAAGLLDLLRQLYDVVLVPSAVRDEIEPGRLRGEPGPALGAPEWSWLPVQASVSIPAEVGLRKLDSGEQAVLALALTYPREQVFLLMDDREAREAAADLKLKYTGCLGIVVQAKDAGLIAEARPRIAQLRAAGLWLTDAAVANALKLAGE